MQNQKLKDKFLEYFRQLPVQKLAADFIGKDEDTICRWKKEDPEFADQIASAKSVWVLETTKKVRSKEWLLEKLVNDHFGEKKQEIDKIEVSINDYRSKTNIIPADQI